MFIEELKAPQVSGTRISSPKLTKLSAQSYLRRDSVQYALLHIHNGTFEWKVLVFHFTGLIFLLPDQFKRLVLTDITSRPGKQAKGKYGDRWCIASRSSYLSRTFRSLNNKEISERKRE